MTESHAGVRKTLCGHDAFAVERKIIERCRTSDLLADYSRYLCSIFYNKVQP